MSTRNPSTPHPDSATQTTPADPGPPAGMSRRGFLGRAGGAVAATVTAGSLADLPRCALAAPARGTARLGIPIAGRSRAERAYAIRLACADAHRAQVAPIQTNGDEEAYRGRIGSYTKALPHDARGEVDPVAYATYLAALRSGRPDAFERIPMGGTNKLANPQAAYAYPLEGADSAAIAVPPPPAFASAWEAAEMAELYWQALARDVAFATYASDPLMAAAAADLSRLSDFRGPKDGGKVTPATLFSMGLAGELSGPPISQFLWQPVPYGAMTINQLYPLAPRSAFLTSWDAWLSVQQGRFVPPKLRPGAAPLATRHIITGRDLATFLKADFSYQAYLNAALILLKGGALAVGNPYLHSRTQVGAGTFGPQYLLDLVAKVANAAVKASWYHKWLVHRRARPEEFGGRVQLHKVGLAESPIHADLLSTSGVLDVVHREYGTYLLPAAYADGCPLHPSYPAAHPTIAGACVTVVKACFDEAAVLPNPVLADPEGRRLLHYSGPPLTVGGELNKLAGNVAMGRAFGGVHWRSDNVAGLRIGEAVAIAILADERHTYNEAFRGFSLTAFGGTPITI